MFFNVLKLYAALLPFFYSNRNRIYSNGLSAKFASCAEKHNAWIITDVGTSILLIAKK